MANALQRVGINFDLYEQAPALTEIGAGIGLSNGAIKLLDSLGLGDDVKSKGFRIKNVYLANKKLQIRRKLPAKYPGICIHRAFLIDILKNSLPEDHIHLNKMVTDIQSYREYNDISFSDGTTCTSECTVAADGINSVIRSRIFPGITIRYINQTIWRGITKMEVPDILRDSYIEVWDEGLRFLTVPFNSEKTFWLAVEPAPPGINDKPDKIKNELLDLFKNFHSVFRELISNSGEIFRNDMADLGQPDHPWHHNRVVFLGDSIHATTPNLAQGGCQAIEDAICLALCLKKYSSDLKKAFQTYQRLRVNKVTSIVYTSWKFGVAAHSANPLYHYLFRAILEYSPATILSRQEEFLNDYSYLKEVDDIGLLTPEF